MTKYIALLLLLMCGSGLTFASTLTATPDRTVIGEDETLQLTVRIDEQIGFGGPDFSELEDNFDILNQHRSNQFRSINGRTEGWTEWNLILAPKRAGSLVIPSLNFEGESSNAVEITVRDASTAPAGELREIFAEMEVDKDNVYVQEQLLVTYRVFSAVQLRDIGLEKQFAVENANVEVVSETNFRRTINNQVYRAYEIIYAVHPQKSETITIPGLTWQLVTATARTGNWFNEPFRSTRGQLKRLRTESRQVTVKPRPTNYSGVDWLPAQEITLEQHWSADPSRFVVGEPITRTLTLSAKGLAASQLAAIPQIDSDKVKVYSDQPQFDETQSREGLTGVRIETSAIVPTEAGDFSLPPVRITWWDTVNDREQVTELPAQRVNVAPAAIDNLPQPAQSPTPALDNMTAVDDANTGAAFSWRNWTGYWPLLVSNAVFALLSLGFMLAWLMARHNPRVREDYDEPTPENHNLNTLTRQLRIACGDNQAAKAKELLGLWGQAYWQLPHRASLRELSNLSGCQKFTRELERLDKFLYGKDADSQWQGSTLWSAIVRLQKQRQTDNRRPRQSSSLKPLYPNQAQA